MKRYANDGCAGNHGMRMRQVKVYKIAILTRNATHGGVETMVALHQRCLKADVFVTGGSNLVDTCPFSYTFISAEDRNTARAQLQALLSLYDVIIYHWIEPWAVEAVRAVDKPSIEVVHREDTSDCDKTVPSLVITHSHFLADFLYREHNCEAMVIPHGVDVERFPKTPSDLYVGAITRYDTSKGIDLFFTAWAKIQDQFPNQTLRFYGTGSDLVRLQQMVADLALKNVELLDPIADPARHITEYKLFVLPSRQDGMPFALMEALAANVPVICSDLPAMVEFNREAERRGVARPLILFRAGDADDLAEKISENLLAPPKRSETRNYIRNYYSVEAHCRNYWIAIGRAIEAYRSRQTNRMPQVKTIAISSTVSPSANWFEWTFQDVEQLHWLARLSYQVRQNRWYPFLKRIGKLFL